MARDLSAVIFDLDGVITDTAEFHYRAWKMIADEVGLKFDRQLNQRLRGVERLKSLEIILNANERTLSSQDKETLAGRKNNLYVELLSALTPADILPGIAQLLKELNAGRVKTALASVSRNAALVLQRLDMQKTFDYVADPRSLAQGKPAPDIFVKCALALGADFADCVGIEDAAAGVRAIKAAGMIAVGVGDPAILHEADQVVSSTRQLTLGLLRGILIRRS